MPIPIALRFITASILLTACASIAIDGDAVVDLKGAKFTYNSALWSVVSQRGSQVDLNHLPASTGDAERVYVESYSIGNRDIEVLVQNNLKSFSDIYHNVRYRESRVSNKDVYIISFDVTSTNTSSEMYFFERDGFVFCVVFYSKYEQFEKFRTYFYSFIEKM